MTERRTAVDLAQILQVLGDMPSPQAEKPVLVMDHLNTHKLAAWPAAFAPAKTRRRLERYYPLKHGRWFNMAEIAVSVLAGPCWDGRISDLIILTQEVAAWERQKQAAQCPDEWRFITYETRINR